jgi:SOS response regulatory protein OraA/RecX
MSLLRISTRTEAPRTAIIELDKEVWGTLPMRVLLPFLGCEQSGEISDDRREELLELVFEHHRAGLFDYLAKSEHSEWQCKLFLKRKLLHRYLIDRLIDEAKDKNFLSNDRYAEILIRSLAEMGKSRRYIISKLQVQRIPSTLYEPYLLDYLQRDDSLARLETEVKNILLRCSNLPFIKRKEKVFTTLYRKGWEMDLIRAAWDKALERE